MLKCKTMKSKLIILAALALSSCKKEWECNLKIKTVMILGNGETYRNEYNYVLPFQGDRKEMKAFEDYETKIYTIKNPSGFTIMQTNVMTCK